MHLIDHPTAAAGNQFTDGNASAGIQATRVTAKWCNAIQSELANFITSRGIILDDTNNGQLAEAINSVAENLSSPNLVISNNATLDTALTGMILDKAKFKSAEYLCDVFRKTATLEYNSIVKLNCIFRPIENKWRLYVEEIGDVSGATFSINETTGQISYKSSNMAGGSYEGILRYKVSRINLN